MLSRTLRLLSFTGSLDNNSDRSHPEIARQYLGKPKIVTGLRGAPSSDIPRWPSRLQAGISQLSLPFGVSEMPTAIYREQNTTRTQPKTLAEVSDYRHGITVIAVRVEVPAFRGKSGKVGNRRNPVTPMRCGEGPLS
jgi:hypothetical protein